MDRWRVVLVAAVLGVTVTAVAAGPAAARGGHNAEARTAQAQALRAHGTTSQGKPIQLVLHPTGRKVRLTFGFTATCLDFNGLNVFTYEDLANMSGRSTPYTTSGGGSRLETRVRFNVRASATVYRPLDSGRSLAGNVHIRITGVIRVLAGTHLRATGTIQPTAEVYFDDSPPIINCSSGETPLTYSVHSGLP